MMTHLIGLIMVFVIPCVLGAFAIAIPFRSHRVTKKDRFLTLGVLNAVFCGLAMFALGFMVVLNGYPSFLPYLIIAGGFGAMLIFEVTKRFGK